MRTEDGYRKCRERYDEPGHAHYLTFSCFRNQPFLARDRTRQWLADAIRAAKTRHPFELWGWVFMLEHVHLLIRPQEGVRICDVLASIKIPVARRAARFVQEQAPEFLPRMLEVGSDGHEVLRFWQRGGGYDRNIFSAEEVYEKIGYIHKNPLRRELVAGPEDWVWSSYRAWEENVDEPLAIDRENLPPRKI